MKIIGISIVLSIWFFTDLIYARTTEKSSMEYDPTFNQELTQMDPSDEFLDASRICK